MAEHKNASGASTSSEAPGSTEPTAPATSEVDKLRDEVKVALLEQETRPIALVHNLISHWAPSGNSSPEQSLASKKAFFGALARYFIFSKALGAAGGALGLIGGLVALGSLVVSLKTLGEMSRQTELLSDDLQQARRATNTAAYGELIKDLGSVKGSSLDELTALRVFTVAEALVPYQASPSLFRFSEYAVAPELFEPDKNRLVSPQRGALLVAIRDKFADTSFTLRPRFDNALLINVDLSNRKLQSLQANAAILNFASLHDGDLSSSDFAEASLKYARLYGATLDNVDFSNADLMLADLSGTSLAETMFAGASLEGTDLRKVKNASGKSLCRAKTLFNSQVDNALQSEICSLCPEKSRMTVGTRKVEHIVGKLEAALQCPPPR